MFSSTSHRISTLPAPKPLQLGSSHGLAARRSVRSLLAWAGAERSSREEEGCGSKAGRGAGSAETVSAWLARHQSDPQELSRQAPVWDALAEALGGRQAALEAVQREPRLLGMAAATVADNAAAMRALRLSGQEVRQSVLKCPELFLADFGSEEMQAKFAYLPAVLGRSVRHVLANQPHLLLHPLPSVHRKVVFMQYKGDEYYRQTLTWVNMSDATFCLAFHYDPVEFEEYEGGAVAAGEWAT